MPKLIDRTGEMIGFWTVLQRAEAPPPDDPSIKRRADYNPNAKKVTWWLCRCLCGTERIVAANSLRKRGSESCGCQRRKPNLGFGAAALNRVMKNYTDKAETRGILFDLCLGEFRNIVEQECHYCGAPPTQRMEVRYPPKPWYIPFLYNGIDRRDNNLGYTLQNCLPCCGTCNMMKRDMGYQEFLDHIAKIHACLSNYSLSNG